MTESDDISALRSVMTETMSTENLHSLSHQLSSVLAMLTAGEASNIFQNVANSDGFEAWRVLSKQYDPASSGRKRTVLSSILRPGEYEINELKSAIAKWELKIRVYDRKQATSGGSMIQDDIKASILLEMCEGKLK